MQVALSEQFRRSADYSFTDTLSSRSLLLPFVFRFVPQYFHADISSGRPALTEAGRKAIEGERELQGYKDGSGLPSNEKAEGVEAKDTAQ